VFLTTNVSIGATFSITKWFKPQFPFHVLCVLDFLLSRIIGPTAIFFICTLTQFRSFRNIYIQKRALSLPFPVSFILQICLEMATQTDYYLRFLSRNTYTTFVFVFTWLVVFSPKLKLPRPLSASRKRAGWEPYYPHHGRTKRKKRSVN
jgi:hypothetical protein